MSLLVGDGEKVGGRFEEEREKIWYGTVCMLRCELYSNVFGNLIASDVRVTR